MDNTKINKKNKSLRIMIFVILLLLLIVVVMIYLKYKDDKISVNSDLTTIELLYNDYNEGKLTTDEYARNLLFDKYNEDLLEEKYKSFKKSGLSDIDRFIEKHESELSESTLKYYAEKLALKGVTFELDKDNNIQDEDKLALSDLFIEEVNASEDDVTNLEHALLSKNKNFIVWYTESGDSAVDYNTAKTVADGLEDTVEEYKKIFNSDFILELDIFSKGETYEKQKSILKKENISEEYLEKALPVYLINYTDNAIATYIGGSGFIRKLLDKISGGDKYGAISMPYILIRPSELKKDSERTMQIYNHELFHHYQYTSLCGDTECEPGDDPYIVEATANLASALVTKKTTTYGFLNEWAAAARKYSSNLLSKEWSKKYGEDNVGYALFVYLYNYSNNIFNGIDTITKSIYEDDALDFLSSYAGTDGSIKVQRELSLKNLTQDYDNMNLIQSPDYDGELKIIDVNKYINENQVLNEIYPLGINYYKISYNKEKYYDINFKREGYNAVLFLIVEKNNKFAIIDSVEKLYDHDNTLSTKDYASFDNLYVVVANTKPETDTYELTFTEKIQEKKKDYYLSFYDCSIMSEDISKKIDTYYFNEKDNSYKLIVTQYFTDNADIDDYYEIIRDNKNYINVKMKNNIIQYQYSDEAFDKYQTLRTKEKISNYYGSICNLGCMEGDCSWNTGGDGKTDFNPEKVF